MPVDVFAADEQTAWPVDLERWSSLARSVLVHRGITGDVEVSLLFVDEAAIAALNERFLGRPGPTDVLAFPVEDDPPYGGRSPDVGGPGPGSDVRETPLSLLGDVVVCPIVAANNAQSHGVSYEDEIALLVVHGLLHLLGMDHEIEAEAEVMESLERLLLDLFHHQAKDPKDSPSASVGSVLGASIGGEPLGHRIDDVAPETRGQEC